MTRDYFEQVFFFFAIFVSSLLKYKTFFKFVAKKFHLPKYKNLFKSECFLLFEHGSYFPKYKKVPFPEI